MTVCKEQKIEPKILFCYRSYQTLGRGFSPAHRCSFWFDPLLHGQSSNICPGKGPMFVHLQDSLRTSHDRSDVKHQPLLTYSAATASSFFQLPLHYCRSLFFFLDVFQTVLWNNYNSYLDFTLNLFAQARPSHSWCHDSRLLLNWLQNHLPVIDLALAT